MSAENSLLGQKTDYPEQYCPQVLFPIARLANRQGIDHIAGVHQGMDWWHVFELSWLDDTGKPCVAMARLGIPAHSPNLIESKSLKLYFNSLNFCRFEHQQALKETVCRDLSVVAQAPVEMTIFGPHEQLAELPSGTCIDDLSPTGQADYPNATLLRHKDSGKIVQNELLYSDLLRSNCPVTSQPDWGTIFIRYAGQQICHQSLLAYIISFRRHCGFHEQCVEQIFADVWQHLQPSRLMVYAAYTRRGGLDINPCRISHDDWLPTPVRLARQ